MVEPARKLSRSFPSPRRPANTSKPVDHVTAYCERCIGDRKGQLVTVIIAFVANVLVAVAKAIAAAITGSAAMVAEAAHSWADAGNEIFLLVADKQAERPEDRAHPFGYGRASFVWSLIAAFGIFTSRRDRLNHPRRLKLARPSAGRESRHPRMQSSASRRSSREFRSRRR